MSSRRGRSRSPSPRSDSRTSSASKEPNRRDEKRKHDSPPEKEVDSAYSLVPPSRRNESGNKRAHSPSPQRERRSPRREKRRSPTSPRSAISSTTTSRQPSPSYIRESDKYGKPQEDNASAGPKIEKEKPNFNPSGKLAAFNKDGTGPALKWGEPPEARLPTKRWRLYVFKEDKPLDPYYIHRQSAYLFGRDRLVVDIPLDHLSCSKQHAVLQYRLVEKENEEGDKIKEVKPYIIDLGSTNGTFLNKERIEDSRYVELRESDVLKFGLSSREFVLLHEDSAE